MFKVEVLTIFSRNRGCGLPTARCYNQLGHMSWCQYWIEEIDGPCGARCRNEKGYCELHTKLRPADFKIAKQNQNAADQAEDTTTISARHGEFIRLAGNFAISDHIAMREKAAKDEVAVQEEGEQGRNEKTNEKGPQDYSVLEPGSSLNVGKDAVTGAEESEGQEPPKLDPEPAASVAMDELKPAFRKKRSRNNNPTKAINKAKKQAEKKVAQEEQLKRGHGKAPKHKKGQKRAY